MPRFLKKILSPFLQLLVRQYLSQTRWYSYGTIRIKVYPGVFHPGLFFSTGVLLKFLSGRDLKGSRVLELGAGTGLLSIYCFKQGATATASDVNETAIENTKENAQLTGSSIAVIESDLFDSLHPDDYDWIVINPPFYPRTPAGDAEKAWYCGSDFDYFQKLFTQFSEKRESRNRIIMVLSEDCDVERISSIAAAHSYISSRIYESKNLWETSFILQWESVGAQ